MERNQEIPWSRILAEIAAIVVGILLAFAIDAWWDNRQESIQRAELVIALRLDFESNKERLAERIQRVESFIARMDRFLELSGGPDTVPLVDLRNTIGGAFRGIGFQASLSAYESAIAADSLRLVQNSGLNQAIRKFQQSLRIFQVFADISAENFFRGPVFELGREIGTLLVLGGDPDEYASRFRRSEAELRELYASPFVYAVVSSQATLHRNVIRQLRGMEAAANDVLSELDKL